MTLKSLWPVTQQFQAKNGSNLVSGKVYIYYQGRTALATTYHDEEGKVVNSNPVLLDNNGRATVFADTIYSYTIVVCDYYGKELFSQDITLHDVTETADEITLIGSDGSIHIDTSSSNGVKTFDMSANTDILATKKSVDDLDIRVKKNEDDIKVISGNVENIATEMSGKKDKQTELTFNGSATKTVKKVIQNANGELNVEFEDIDLPQEVPNVEITSEDSSVNITSSVDAGTNIKTFDLSVNVDDKIPDPSTSNPLMDGTASVGSSIKYAREDHVHPSDTSKEAVSNKTSVVIGTSNSKYPTDKAVADFVNSSIATNTANYISNNGEPFTSVEELEAYTGTVTNNDYAFVTGTDSEGNTYYDRYKATVNGSTVTWALEYRLNNSSFTAAQWAAINSGVTSDKANYWDGKQDALTAGDNITIDGNTISSNQVLVAYDGTTKYAEVKAAYDAGKLCMARSRNNYYYLTQINSEFIWFVASNPSPNISALKLTRNDKWEFYSQSLQRKLTFDTTPTAGSTNPVTSDGINSALNSKANAGNFVFVRGAKCIMLKFPKGLNLYDGVFVNILNGYGGKSYRNITFAIRKEGTVSPQVERYNTDVSSNTFPGSNKFSVYYGTYPSDPNNNIVLIVPAVSITGIVHLSWGDSRATWTVLYDTPNTTGLSIITPIEHNNVFGANKGSASVPVYVDANGEATPCTDDFVHDSDLDSRIPAPTSTTGTQVLKCINGVIQWVNE